MALKFTIDKLEDAPEAVRSLYTEQDGKFVLGVEGAVSSARLDEFRTNNINLARERDGLLDKYKGIDPAKARAALTLEQQIAEKKLLDDGEVEKVIDQRVAEMRKDHQTQITNLTGERDTLSTKLGGLVIDTALRDAATKAGVMPSAIDDVLLRGRTVFKLKDGEAVAMKGDEPLFGKTSEPLRIDEWVGGLTATAPHLFAPSKGGGANQGQPSAGGAGKTMTRAAFDALSPTEKHATATSGTKIID